MHFTDQTSYDSLPSKYHGAFRKWKAYHAKPLDQVFWQKVDRRGPDECWPFLGGRMANRKHSYGLFYWRGHGKFKQSVAHRIAWIVTHGAIPNGLWVLHKCDNPPCCNPNHLFLGTHQDNMDDCKHKGRNFIPIGELSPCHRLSEHDVVAIRSTYSKGDITYCELAKMYGVSKGAIQHVVNRRTWTHVI